MHQSYVGYFLYTEFLFFFSGVMLIVKDAKTYVEAKNMKESRAARLLGWVNLAAGLVGAAAYLVYSSWIL